jgi:predicted dehydrogenase
MVLRIGVLGAARIAPNALLKPARSVPEVEVAAIAARDPAKAGAFAKKHDIPTVHQGYDALLADESLDAVYNPLPNGLHGRWTIAALQAGKHVLCEKPFTANADEARAVADVARGTDRVVMEAFHWRYHPFTQRCLDIIGSGELGEVRHVETRMVIPLPLPRDIRWQLPLAGGSLMDVGCYALHQLRTYAGAEPEITAATAKLLKPGIDRWVEAQARFPDGRTGQITASMLSGRFLAIDAKVIGTEGTLAIRNQVAPHLLGKLTVKARGTTRSEGGGSKEPTYLHQLRAFAGAVLRGEPFPTGLDDAIANMAAIDACYRAAGLEPRQPSA